MAERVTTTVLPEEMDGGPSQWKWTVHDGVVIVVHPDHEPMVAVNLCIGASFDESTIIEFEPLKVN